MTFGAPRNPFSTRNIRPGAVPYFFDGSASVEAILDRFEHAGRVGEIVGPHGTGKTTLVHALLTEWERRGLSATLVTLQDGRWSLPRVTWSEVDVLVVDGAEQLPWWRGRLLRWTAKREGVGLLMTSHAPLGLPLLHRTRADLGVAKTVAAHVLTRSPELPALVSADEVEHAPDAEHGNLREALLRLYDTYEARFIATQP